MPSVSGSPLARERSAADRRTTLTDAAIAVLGAEGSRALTHRRVDQESGLPTGSTSNLFRSREELLVGALDRLIELEIGDALSVPALEPSDSIASGAALLAELIRVWTTPEHRARLQARFELLVEATRRPAFGTPLLARRNEIIAAVERLMLATDRPDARRRAVSLVAWVDGLLLHHLLDPSVTSDEQELEALIVAQLS